MWIKRDIVAGMTIEFGLEDLMDTDPLDATPQFSNIVGGGGDALLSLTPAELTVRRRALGLDSGSSRPPSSVSTLVRKLVEPAEARSMGPRAAFLAASTPE